MKIKTVVLTKTNNFDCMKEISTCKKYSLQKDSSAFLLEKMHFIIVIILSIII